MTNLLHWLFGEYYKTRLSAVLQTDQVLVCSGQFKVTEAEDLEKFVLSEGSEAEYEEKTVNTWNLAGEVKACVTAAKAPWTGFAS